jgi:hypothetical protein
MAIRTELTLVIENKLGACARVFRHLSDEHINILAMQLEHAGLLRLVVDNPRRAAELLRDRLFKIEERDVLYTVMPNDPGALGLTARLLEEAGVNVEYLYATAVDGQTTAAVVFGVPDALKASAAAGI